MHPHTVPHHDSLEDAGLLAVVAGLDFDFRPGHESSRLTDLKRLLRWIAVEQDDLGPGNAIDLALNLDLGDLVRVRNGLAVYRYGGRDQVGLGDNGGGHSQSPNGGKKICRPGSRFLKSLRPLTRATSR